MMLRFKSIEEVGEAVAAVVSAESAGSLSGVDLEAVWKLRSDIPESLYYKRLACYRESLIQFGFCFTQEDRKCIESSRWIFSEGDEEAIHFLKCSQPRGSFYRTRTSRLIKSSLPNAPWGVHKSGTETASPGSSAAPVHAVSTRISPAERRKTQATRQRLYTELVSRRAAGLLKRRRILSEVYA